MECPNVRESEVNPDMYTPPIAHKADDTYHTLLACTARVAMLTKFYMHIIQWGSTWTVLLLTNH